MSLLSKHSKWLEANHKASGSIHILPTHNITVNGWCSSSAIEQILMYYLLALHLKTRA